MHLFLQHSFLCQAPCSGSFKQHSEGALSQENETLDVGIDRAKKRKFTQMFESLPDIIREAHEALWHCSAPFSKLKSGNPIGIQNLSCASCITAKENDLVLCLVHHSPRKWSQGLGSCPAQLHPQLRNKGAEANMQAADAMGPGARRKFKTEVVNAAFDRKGGELVLSNPSKPIFQQVLTMSKTRYSDKHKTGVIKAVARTMCGGEQGSFSRLFSVRSNLLSSSASSLAAAASRPIWSIRFSIFEALLFAETLCALKPLARPVTSTNSSCASCSGITPRNPSKSSGSRPSSFPPQSDYYLILRDYTSRRSTSFPPSPWCLLCETWLRRLPAPLPCLFRAADYRHLSWGIRVFFDSRNGDPRWGSFSACLLITTHSLNGSWALTSFLPLPEGPCNAARLL